ncbi:MAG: hypothetical protein MMC23_007600 [Stictis urceolatum]|nr:hypothetical protein [Stictis urceolata]
MSPNRSGKNKQAEEEAEDSSTPPTRFAPEEEAALLREANEQKASANKLYASSAFSEAIGEYDKALASCPNYLDYEVAVLKSNIAACHIKLEEWKEAVEAASAALDGLERIDPTAKKEKKGADTGKDSLDHGKAAEEEGTIVELDDDEEEAERALAKLKLSDERREQVRTLRAKSLMRRARANAEQGGWATLAAAEEDYKAVLALGVLPAADQKFVRAQLVALPPRINVAKENEMGEMMGKLKDLGNGFLKPFGLSTDMFKFNKDENTGGYSMSFDGNAKS